MHPVLHITTNPATSPPPSPPLATPSSRIPLSKNSLQFLQSRFSAGSEIVGSEEYELHEGNETFTTDRTERTDHFDQRNNFETDFQAAISQDSFLQSLQSIPFTKFYAILLLTLTFCLGVTMQILLYVSNNSTGFSNALVRFSEFDGGLGGHYIYTVGGVALALPFMAAWSWFDYELKLMQPLIDLHRGGSSPENSLLLNYTSSSNFVVPFYAIKRGHVFPLVSSLVCIIALTISPIASSLFYLEKKLFYVSTVNSTSINTFGYDAPELTMSMASAAGYSLARSIYNIPSPTSFTQDGALTQFAPASPSLRTTGFVLTDTIAVKSIPNCEMAASNVTGSSGKFQITASTSKCTLSFTSPFASLGLAVYNIISVKCAGDSSDVRLQSIALWSQTSSSKVEVVICSPTVEVNLVSASTSLLTGIITTGVIGPISSESNPFLSSPFNSRPFNGIFFNSTDTAVQAAQADITQAYAQIVPSVNTTIRLLQISNFYQDYLFAFGSTAYFTSTATIQSSQFFDLQPRLFVAPIAAWTLTTAFFLIFLVGSGLMYFHWKARQGISIVYRLGTIASAAALLGNIATVFEPKDDLRALLVDHKFSLRNGKIIVDAEEKIIISPSTPLSPTTPSTTLLRERLRRASSANGAIAF